MGRLKRLYETEHDFRWIWASELRFQENNHKKHGDRVRAKGPHKGRNMRKTGKWTRRKSYKHRINNTDHTIVILIFSEKEIKSIQSEAMTRIWTQGSVRIKWIFWEKSQIRYSNTSQYFYKHTQGKLLFYTFYRQEHRRWNLTWLFALNWTVMQETEESWISSKRKENNHVSVDEHTGNSFARTAIC